MPSSNVDDQQTYRQQVGAGARMADLAAIIAAGPYHSTDPLHVLAVDVERARTEMHTLAAEHPQLRPVAQAMDVVATEVNDYAEAAGL